MRLNRSVLAAALLTVTATTSSQAAYFDLASWYGSASEYIQDGYVLTAMPEQHHILGEDAFGSFTYETRNEIVSVGVKAPPYTDPTRTRSRNAWLFPDNGAGQLSGNFDCHSFIYTCFGAFRFTYVLPFEIVGLAGDLSITHGYSGNAQNIPFFDFDANYLNQSSSGGPNFYSGFWGATFPATSVLTITWVPGLWSTDDSAGFALNNLTVLTNQVVAVPAPGALALFATALGLLGIVGRRATQSAQAG